MKLLAQSKSHLFVLCEISEINLEEYKFLRGRGWNTLSNRYGDILIGYRTNFIDENMKRLVGFIFVGEAHESLLCSYMIRFSRSASKETTMIF